MFFSKGHINMLLKKVNLWAMYGVKHVIWHSSDQKNIVPYKKN